jgi:hypothetical protein
MAYGLSDQGQRIDMVMARKAGHFLDEIRPAIRIRIIIETFTGMDRLISAGELLAVQRFTEGLNHHKIQKEEVYYNIFAWPLDSINSSRGR